MDFFSLKSNFQQQLMYSTIKNTLSPIMVGKIIHDGFDHNTILESMHLQILTAVKKDIILYY